MQDTPIHFKKAGALVSKRDPNPGAAPGTAGEAGLWAKDESAGDLGWGRGRWPRSGPRREELKGRQEEGKPKNGNQGEKGRRDPTQRAGPGEKEGRQRNAVAT